MQVRIPVFLVLMLLLPLAHIFALWRTVAFAFAFALPGGLSNATCVHTYIYIYRRIVELLYVYI